jgi:hypothetical protein
MKTPHQPTPRWRLINADDFRMPAPHGKPADGSLSIYNDAASMESGKMGRLPHARRCVSMPVAGTDLEEIFQDDAVCMVHRPAPKPAAEPPAASPPETDQPTDLSDPRLLELLKRWPLLPADIQSEVLAVAETASDAD